MGMALVRFVGKDGFEMWMRMGDAQAKAPEIRIRSYNNDQRRFVGNRVIDGPIYYSEDITGLAATEPTTNPDIVKDMCRALLAVEWRYSGCCLVCNGFQGRHFTCLVDAALTKAGLPDQTSRNAARKELGL